MEDEHFIVWMRTAGAPNFSKLWGKLDLTEFGGKLKKGSYHLEISNAYDVSKLITTKSVILTNTNVFGGFKNYLPMAYIMMGTFCFFFCLIFFMEMKR